MEKIEKIVVYHLKSGITLECMCVLISVDSDTSDSDIFSATDAQVPSGCLVDKKFIKNATTHVKCLTKNNNVYDLMPAKEAFNQICFICEELMGEITLKSY